MGPSDPERDGSTSSPCPDLAEEQSYWMGLFVTVVFLVATLLAVFLAIC